MLIWIELLTSNTEKGVRCRWCRLQQWYGSGTRESTVRVARRLSSDGTALCSLISVVGRTAIDSPSLPRDRVGQYASTLQLWSLCICKIFYVKGLRISTLTKRYKYNIYTCTRRYVCAYQPRCPHTVSYHTVSPWDISRSHRRMLNTLKAYSSSDVQVHLCDDIAMGIRTRICT